MYLLLAGILIGAGALASDPYSLPMLAAGILLLILYFQ